MNRTNSTGVVNNSSAESEVNFVNLVNQPGDLPGQDVGVKQGRRVRPPPLLQARTRLRQQQQVCDKWGLCQILGFNFRETPNKYILSYIC